MTEFALNLNGTSDRRVPLGYPSALALLSDFYPRASLRCSVSGCFLVAEVGAHVKLYDGDDRHVLVPMCIAHNNQRGQIVEIRENCPRVLASSRELRRELSEDEEPEWTTGEQLVVIAGVAVAGYALWQLLKPKPAPPPLQPARQANLPGQPWTQPVAPPGVAVVEAVAAGRPRRGAPFAFVSPRSSSREAPRMASRTSEAKLLARSLRAEWRVVIGGEASASFSWRQVLE